MRTRTAVQRLQAGRSHVLSTSMNWDSRDVSAWALAERGSARGQGYATPASAQGAAVRQKPSRKKRSSGCVDVVTRHKAAGNPATWFGIGPERSLELTIMETHGRLPVGDGCSHAIRGIAQPEGSKKGGREPHSREALHKRTLRLTLM